MDNSPKEKGRREEIETEYKIALENYPSNAAIRSNYALLLKELGRWEEAEKQYKTALEIDSKNAAIHSNYGLLLVETGRRKEAEKHYIFALGIDSSNAVFHYNYGVLLAELGRWKESEKYYRSALEINPNNVNTRSNYAHLLKQMGRIKEAKEQFMLSLEINPNNVNTRSNYGLLLKQIGHWEEAEEQYKIALKIDPKHVNTHYNYGVFLVEKKRRKEAVIQYKLAIDIDGNNPNSHIAYSLLLLSMGLEEKSIEKMEIASNLFKEKGDYVKECLVLAWLYEELSNKHYKLKKYIKSGDFAEKSGSKYIEAGNKAGDKLKDVSLTKGYTLLGRSKIRKVEIKVPFYKDALKRILKRHSYELEKFERIIDCIKSASKCYEKAAQVSPKNNQVCVACSSTMSCLCDMIDHMVLMITRRDELSKMDDILKSWSEELETSEKIYNEHSKGKYSKGEQFVESLKKLMECIESLNKYNALDLHGKHSDSKKCVEQLYKIVNNMEGPLQSIIEVSANKMDKYLNNILPYTKNERSELTNELDYAYRIKKWILYASGAILISIVSKIAVDFILKTFLS
ncbi:hypothetical protein MSKOL_3068 [Methanosarcina sp. Kolksee]|uniref:tetratricopeptide repeat protein n=1 Tax=Methanosarcina sp. Kolksee TaxID=1434099 RepID=UPI000615F501|nr:tetratricopeptide repeat protein [Methanosarcina sp. Kolksee]AKB48845.1 hypothetical protein MSKOL_3068 [Methanosarcina sp. Kolksee]